MANLRKWLTGQEVMKKLDISRLDLLELVEDGKLQAHDPDEREYYLMGVPVKLSKDGIDFAEQPIKLFTKEGKDGIIFVEQPKTPDELEKCYFAVKDVETIQDKQPQNKRREVNKPVLISKPETQWEDIIITLVSDDTVRIKTLDIEQRFNYSELGLSDKRKGDTPTILWELLKLFATMNGFISSNNSEYNATLPDTAKRLNKHLKNLFGINESIYAGHYKKEGGYRTRINFSSQTITS